MPGSFNNYARKVRNVEKPFSVRYSALASCILRLGWLTGRTFQQVRLRYAPQFVTGNSPGINEVQLLAALAAIERDRNIYLEALRRFERLRIRQKQRGQRHPRKADKEALVAAKPVV